MQLAVWKRETFRGEKMKNSMPFICIHKVHAPSYISKPLTQRAANQISPPFAVYTLARLMHTREAIRQKIKVENANAARARETDKCVILSPGIGRKNKTQPRARPRGTAARTSAPKQNNNGAWASSSGGKLKGHAEREKRVLQRSKGDREKS